MHRTAFSLTIAIVAYITSATLKAEGTNRWLTDASTGVRLWNPAPAAGESVEWHGAANAASGPGIAIWKINGVETEQAAGRWKAGKLDGYGVWQDRHGNRYEGHWKNGRKDGFGVYTWADGQRFCGRYRDDKRQNGLFFQADGTAAGDRTPSPAAHQQAFEAEAAALQARQVASDSWRQATRIKPLN